MAALWTALAAIVVCLAIGWLSGRVGLGRDGRAPSSPVEPPVLSAFPGLMGAAAVGVAIWGGGVSHPALAIGGVGLVAVGDDVAVGRRVSWDRVIAIGLVMGACLVPLARYGAASYSDLRGASLVLGPPATTGPWGRLGACLFAALVAVASGAYLGGAERRASLATVAASPRLLTPGAVALVVSAPFAGSALAPGAPLSDVARRVGVWAGAVAVAVGGQWWLSARMRRLRWRGGAAVAAAVLLALAVARATR